MLRHNIENRKLRRSSSYFRRFHFFEKRPVSLSDRRSRIKYHINSQLHLFAGFRISAHAPASESFVAKKNNKTNSRLINGCRKLCREARSEEQLMLQDGREGGGSGGNNDQGTTIKDKMARHSPAARPVLSFFMIFNERVCSQ